MQQAAFEQASEEVADLVRINPQGLVEHLDCHLTFAACKEECSIFVRSEVAFSKLLKPLALLGYLGAMPPQFNCDLVGGDVK